MKNNKTPDWYDEKFPEINEVRELEKQLNEKIKYITDNYPGITPLVGVENGKISVGMSIDLGDLSNRGMI